VVRLARTPHEHTTAAEEDVGEGVDADVEASILVLIALAKILLTKAKVKLRLRDGARMLQRTQPRPEEAEEDILPTSARNPRETSQSNKAQTLRRMAHRLIIDSTLRDSLGHLITSNHP
jgi:hypothetical protein